MEKRLLSDINLKPYIRRDINDIFLIWEHVEESLKLFLEKINPTVRFTADCSYSLVNVLDVKVILKDRNIITDLYVKPYTLSSMLRLFVMLSTILQKK